MFLQLPLVTLFITDSKIPNPSIPPINFSQAFSGCGIIPKTLPSLLIIPAMLLIEPLGFEIIFVSPSSEQYLNITLFSSSSSFIVLSSAWKLPSPCEIGILIISSFLNLFVNIELLFTFKFDHSHTNDKSLFLRSIPGKSCVSHKIWNPLHIPITGPPEFANSFTLLTIGEKLAIAPVLK